MHQAPEHRGWRVRSNLVFVTLSANGPGRVGLMSWSVREGASEICDESDVSLRVWPLQDRRAGGSCAPQHPKNWGESLESRREPMRGHGGCIGWGLSLNVPGLDRQAAIQRTSLGRSGLNAGYPVIPDGTSVAMTCST